MILISANYTLNQLKMEVLFCWIYNLLFFILININIRARVHRALKDYSSVFLFMWNIVKASTASLLKQLM